MLFESSASVKNFELTSPDEREKLLSIIEKIQNQNQNQNQIPPSFSPNINERRSFVGSARRSVQPTPAVNNNNNNDKTAEENYSLFIGSCNFGGLFFFFFLFTLLF